MSLKDGLLRRVAFLFRDFLALDDLVLHDVREIDNGRFAFLFGRGHVAEEEAELMFGKNIFEEQQQ